MKKDGEKDMLLEEINNISCLENSTTSNNNNSCKSNNVYVVDKSTTTTSTSSIDNNNSMSLNKFNNIDIELIDILKTHSNPLEMACIYFFTKYNISWVGELTKLLGQNQGTIYYIFNKLANGSRLINLTTYPTKDEKCKKIIDKMSRAGYRAPRKSIVFYKKTDKLKYLSPYLEEYISAKLPHEMKDKIDNYKRDFRIIGSSNKASRERKILKAKEQFIKFKTLCEKNKWSLKEVKEYSKKFLLENEDCILFLKNRINSYISERGGSY